MALLNKRFLRCLLGLCLSAATIITLVDSKTRPCYTLKMLSMRTTETPHYRLEMTLHGNQTLSSVTRVLKEVPITVWHIRIQRYSTGNGNDKGKSNKASGGGRRGSGKNRTSDALLETSKTLYNATYKTCEFWKYVRRISVFSNVADMVLSKERTNLSLSCPLPVGTYVMRNIHVPPDTGLLRYMFLPNTIYTFYGTIYSQRSDKSLEKKCSYEINGTVAKTC